jgi:uncharacterized membrane protein YkvA (DUF1232 family)
MGFLGSLTKRAALLKGELVALSIAARDRRTPLAAKLLVLVVLAYAVSPIDLIPDFIPVIGLLDDVLLIPIGLAIAIRMIPREVMIDARAAAPAAVARFKRYAFVGVALTILLWIAIGVGIYYAIRAIAG